VIRRAATAAVASAAALAALSASGCGDEGRTALTDTQRTSSPALTQAPTPPPTPTATQPATGAAPAPTTPATGTVDERSGGAVAPEEQEGGAGDETAARTPITISIDGDSVTPRESRVPPFLGVKLTLRSRDGAAHSVRIATVPGQFEVPASGASARDVDGLQPGTYAVLVDGRSTDAVLRVGTGG